MKTSLIISALAAAFVFSSCSQQQGNTSELPANVEIMQYLRNHAANQLRPSYEQKYGKNFNQNEAAYQQFLYDVNKTANKARAEQIKNAKEMNPNYVPVEVSGLHVN